MSQPPKHDPPPNSPNEPVSEKRDERNAWRDEQEKHAYYYDDAHGYQEYDPDKDDDSDPAPSPSPPVE